MSRKVILFEMNEVPFRVIDHFAQVHPDSAIAKLTSASQSYETFAEDSVLSPWVTWPTVHRGVTDAQHKLHHFGQDLTEPDREYPPIWRILADRGIKTGVFGSLHSYPMPKSLENFAFYMPDTFAAESDAHPKQLSIFQDFNLSMARQSTRNVSGSIPLGQGLTLLQHSFSLGLTFGTFADVAGQVLNERLQPATKVRRRTYQSVFAFDVFLRQLSKTQPAFTTFFTNHVASALHRYWAAAYPDDYAEMGLGFDDKWIAQYRDEIGFAMRKSERFLGKLLHFVKAHPEYLLIVASSMGQAAANGEPVRTQLYLMDIPRFMTTLGIGKEDWSQRPAMAPTVSLYLQGPAADKFRAALDSITIGGQPLEYEEMDRGFFSLSLGHPNLTGEDNLVQLAGKPQKLDSLGFVNLRIEDESGSSAYHVREGSLLVYDPRHPVRSAARVTIPTTEIAPSILALFGVPVPSYMKQDPMLAQAFRTAAAA